ncbi:MAG: LysM domain-containing protein [Comamonadaceae bacterium]|nr:LysM domain-containing protein [Comamonadaceae bacterium]
MSISPVAGSRFVQSPPPAKPEKTYTVQRGDTIGKVAEQHKVSTQALIAKNPQVNNPDVLYPGDVLKIPEAKTSAAAGSSSLKGQGKLTAKPDAGSGDAAAKNESKGENKPGSQATSKAEPHVSVDANGKVTAGDKHTQTTKTTNAKGTERSSSESNSASVSIDPAKGAFSVSTGTGFTESVKTSKGVGVSFGFNANASVVSGLSTKDGVTTFTTSGDVSVGFKAGLDIKQAGFEYGYTQGIKSSFEVSMPEQAARNTPPGTVNPYTPDSMPTGTVIKIDGANYATNEFKASFKNIAVQTKVTDEQGTSVLVEKTDTSKVRVTAGPTQAINAYNGVGVEFDVAKLTLGRDDKLNTAQLKTAEFDLATPEGQAAYNDFLANGNLPADNGAGVSGVKTVEKMDFSSQSKLEAKLGPDGFNLGINLDGPKNTGNAVVTRYPDGTAEESFKVQYAGNVPLTITRKFGTDGKEIPAERRYAYTLQADDNTAQLLNAAHAGDVKQAKNGPVKAGQTVTLTYTAADMKALHAHAVQAYRANTFNMDLQSLVMRVGVGSQPDEAVSPEEFAIALARNLNGSDYQTGMRLFSISDGADGQIANRQFVKLPGKITVS